MLYPDDWIRERYRQLTAAANTHTDTDTRTHAHAHRYTKKQNQTQGERRTERDAKRQASLP